MKLTATQEHTIELLKEMQKTLIKLNDLIEILINPIITMEEEI